MHVDQTFERESVTFGGIAPANASGTEGLGIQKEWAGVEEEKEGECLRLREERAIS